MKKLIFLLSLALCVAATSYAKSYGIWVKGVQVTDNNRNNILGDGTLSFEPCTDPNGTLTERTSTLYFKGGTISVPFTKTGGKFTYDCFLFVPYQAQSSFTTNTEADYSADEYIKVLDIVIQNDNRVVNTLDETAMDAIHHEGIFSRVPTTFRGTGMLQIKGFNRYTIHVKDDITFESGRYFLENTLLPNAVEGDEWHANIYQEDDDYTLTFQDAFIQMKKGGDWYSSVLYDGSVDADGIAAYINENGDAYHDIHFASGNLIERSIMQKDGYKLRPKNISFYPMNYPIKVWDNGALSESAWVTWDNHHDIAGDSSYSVCYDLETNTLLLRDADLQLNQQRLSVNTDSLNIYCFGSNTISGAYASDFLLQANNIAFSSPRAVSYTFIGTNNVVGGVLPITTFTSTGADSLTITNTSGDALQSDITVANMTLVCQAAEGQDAFSGKAVADIKYDNVNTASFGKEILYPIAIDGIQANQEKLRNMREVYPSFSYDEATNTVTLDGTDMHSCNLKFIQRGTLIAKGNAQLGSLAANYDLDIVATGALTCIGTPTLSIAPNATVTFKGGGSVEFNTAGSSIVCNSQNGSANLVIDSTYLNLKNTPESQPTLSNIGSIVLNKVVITKPSNARFIASKKSVCVDNVPTKKTIEFSRTTSGALIKAVKLTSDVSSVRDNVEKATLTGYVRGNGEAKLYAQWYYREESDNNWLSLGTSITISKADALNGISLTKEFEPSYNESAYRQYRLRVTTGNTTGDKDTVFSNVIEISIAHKLGLWNGGYNYYIYYDENTYEPGVDIDLGDDQDIWVLASDSVVLVVMDDGVKELGESNLDTEFRDLGDGVYSVSGVKHSIGIVQSYTYKYDLYFYADKSKDSLIKSIETYEVDAFHYGESFASKGLNLPVAPTKSSPFAGWLDENKGIIYTADQLMNVGIKANKTFIAIYEDDIASSVEEIPAAALKSKKILFNGQVYILCNNKLYNVSGQVVE